MGFGAEFFKSTEKARAPVLALAATLNPRAVAKPWLVMLWHIIRGTTPTLSHAIAWTADPETTFDSVLFAFLRHKEEEEEGHADLLLADLYRAGFTKQDVAASPLCPHVAEMVGRQFYLIELVHPSAYLGYIGLLEGFVPTLPEVEAFARASGLPLDAFSTARLHAKADVKHKAELSALLDTVPAVYRPAILENGTRCAQLQLCALRQIAHPNHRGTTP